MSELLYLILAGIVGGFLAGFLGVGGGIIYIVVLPLALEKYLEIGQDKLAAMIVANSFFGICVASITSVITHIRANTFYYKETLWVGLPALAVATVAHQLVLKNATYDYLTYNLVVIVILVFVLAYYLLTKGQNTIVSSKAGSNASLKLSISGFLSGLVSVFTGLGGAITLIPLLKYWSRIDVKKSRSISIGMIMLLSLFISIVNLWSDDACAACTGLISWQVTLPLVGGVILSSYVGVKISNVLSKHVVEVIFIIFLSLVLIQKILLLINS